MSDIVPADQIEEIVGATRHGTDHLARADSAAQTVYILHSQECRDATPDLRTCPFSIALDGGIEPDEWIMDRPMRAAIVGGRLTTHLLGVVPGEIAATAAKLDAVLRPRSRSVVK